MHKGEIGETKFTLKEETKWRQTVKRLLKYSIPKTIRNLDSGRSDEYEKLYKINDWVLIIYEKKEVKFLNVSNILSIKKMKIGIKPLTEKW